MPSWYSGIAMPDIIVFNILIPCTENATGIVHRPSKFDDWVHATADRFGGITVRRGMPRSSVVGPRSMQAPPRR
jgi:hypothetical protein